MALTRSEVMKRIRSKDTTPEQVLRKALWSLNRRYRLHYKTPVGRPDVVFPGRKVAVFIEHDVVGTVTHFLVELVRSREGVEHRCVELVNGRVRGCQNFAFRASIRVRHVRKSLRDCGVQGCHFRSVFQPYVARLPI